MRDGRQTGSSRLRARILICLAILLTSLGRYARAQQAQCDNGIVSLPMNVNGTVTICSALAAQVPVLSRQLSEITKALGAQQDQLTELNRLVKGLNSVSQNIGPARQVELLNHLSSQLANSQKAGNQQTQREISNLADGLDSLKDQLVGVLTNRATAEKANAAVDGPVGDAIANLDFATARKLLEDIRAQLKALGNQVGEVNQRTKDIQKTLDAQRMDVSSVKNALLSADVKTLASLSAAGLQSGVIEAALRQKDGDASAARRFFENAANSSAAMEWFDSALAAGVDPNMTIPSEYYGDEGILLEAMRAGNAQAMKALLRRGASPHARQDLFLTSYAESRFLFPLQFIADDDRFTIQEKQDLAKAFLDAGAVVPKVIPANSLGWASVMYEAKKIQDKAPSELGVPLPTSPTLCEQPVTPICKHASSRTGEDWCGIVKTIPKKLTFIFQGQTSSPVYDLELVYLLNIEGNKSYYLALGRNLTMDYYLVEVSKDASSWTVGRFMSPESGMGLCKKDSNGFQPEECWRRVSLQRVAGTDQMRFEDWGLNWKIVNNSCSSPSTK